LPGFVAFYFETFENVSAQRQLRLVHKPLIPLRGKTTLVSTGVISLPVNNANEEHIYFDSLAIFLYAANAKELCTVWHCTDQSEQWNLQQAVLFFSPVQHNHIILIKTFSK